MCVLNRNRSFSETLTFFCSAGGLYHNFKRFQVRASVSSFLSLPFIVCLSHAFALSHTQLCLCLSPFLFLSFFLSLSVDVFSPAVSHYTVSLLPSVSLGDLLLFFLSDISFLLPFSFFLTLSLVLFFVNENDGKISLSANIYHETRHDATAGRVTITMTKYVIKYC